MKFLSKSSSSKVLAERLTYSNYGPGNQRLRALLLEEQKNFCAYTEKYAAGLDSFEVEHFNADLKNTPQDDYYNYYAVLRASNLYKQDERYKSASFFSSRFYQDITVFESRIGYDIDPIERRGIYYAKDRLDQEAIDFIDFIGLNHPELVKDRTKHLDRLRSIFSYARFTDEEKYSYLKEHKEELSFITAIEKELNLDLSEFYRSAG